MVVKTINMHMHKRTCHAITNDIDRCLQLSLSNREFEILANIIYDSEDPEQTARNIIMCGPKIAWYLIKLG